MAIHLPKDDDDPLKFLLRRKYPAYQAYQAPPSLSGYHSGPSFEERSEYMEEVEAYLRKLKALSEHELEKRFAEEKQEERKQLERKRAAEEQGRFFNAPSSRADFAHWAKATSWTLEEAVALSFGKSPEVVNWKKLEQFKNISSFVAEYAKVRDLAIRAKKGNQLSDPVYPGVFLAWAKRLDISCPEELEDLATRYGHNIGDWKTAYDNLKSKFEDLQAQNEELAEKTKQIRAETDEKTRALTEERDALLSQVNEHAAAGKPLNPKERESVLKLIIGMAIEGYRYDPSMLRSPTTKEIADDLSKVGLPTSDDTVRKWLKEAAGLLPTEMKLD